MVILSLGSNDKRRNKVRGRELYVWYKGCHFRRNNGPVGQVDCYYKDIYYIKDLFLSFMSSSIDIGIL